MSEMPVLNNCQNCQLLMGYEMDMDMRLKLRARTEKRQEDIWFSVLMALNSPNQVDRFSAHRGPKRHREDTPISNALKVAAFAHSPTTFTDIKNLVCMYCMYVCMHACVHVLYSVGRGNLRQVAFYPLILSHSAWIAR